MDGLSASETAAICKDAIEAHLILQQIDVGTTIGVGYIGVAISAMAYGMTCCQTFYYYRSNKVHTDPWTTKFIVALLLVLDSLHEVFIIHVFYYYLVLNYARPIALSENIWSLPLGILINTIIASICEGLLVYRLWCIGHNRFITATCIALIVAHTAVGTAYPIESWVHYTNVEESLDKERWLGCLGLAIEVFTDVTISGSLTYYLHKSRTGFRRSDDTITKLIVLTITTGSLTTCFVIANIIVYVAAPETLFIAFFNFLLSKLYINSILSSLNVRDTIRDSAARPTIRRVDSIPLRALGNPAQALPSPSTTEDATITRDSDSLKFGGKNDLKKTISF